MMELGDKTQLAVLSLTARTGRGLVIFAGATLALMVVTLMGVAAGVLAGEFIPMEWLSRLAGVAFVAIGGTLAVFGAVNAFSHNIGFCRKVQKRSQIAASAVLETAEIQRFLAK